MPLGNAAKIGIGWSIITFAGVYSFVLSKNSVDQRRYESMQVRDRMRKSNTGDYEVTSTRRFGA